MQVSLITCTSNSEKTIKDCCLSIFSQSYDDIEHIIIDNNSLDNTLSIAKESKIKCQKIFQQKSTGIYGALNEGLKIVKGDLVGILHSDDQLFDCSVIEKIVKIFVKEDVDVLFANLIYVSRNNPNKIVRKWKSDLKEGMQSNINLNNKIENGWMPPHTTVFIKKNLLSEIGCYDESFKISSDYDYLLKIIKKDSIKFFFLDEYTIKMKIGGTSNKNIFNIFKKMKEDYRVMKKNKFNVFKAILLKNFSKISQFF